MKNSRKSHKDRNRHKNRIKRNNNMVGAVANMCCECIMSLLVSVVWTLKVSPVSVLWCFHNNVAVVQGNIWTVPVSSSRLLCTRLCE